MPQRQILEHPDPRLRVRADAVENFDGELERTVEDLVDTLHATKAIGLAAPQIGASRRVLVVDLSGGAEEPQVYVNPEILSKAALGLVEERCLSVPGVVGNVIRPTEIRVRAQHVNGAFFERDLSAMDAVCLHHELDHLDGRLFLDRLSWFRKLRYRAERFRSLRLAG